MYLMFHWCFGKKKKTKNLGSTEAPEDVFEPHVTLMIFFFLLLLEKKKILLELVEKPQPPDWPGLTLGDVLHSRDVAFQKCVMNRSFLGLGSSGLSGKKKRKTQTNKQTKHLKTT